MLQNILGLVGGTIEGGGVVKEVIDERFAVVGVARRDWSSEGFRSDLGAAVRESSNRAAADERAWAGFAPMLHWVSGSFEDADTYTRLKSKLESLDRERGLEGNRL